MHHFKEHGNLDAVASVVGLNETELLAQLNRADTPIEEPT
jgi:uncharacterized protein (DUF111 family)